jgi:hypothetical protein
MNRARHPSRALVSVRSHDHPPTRDEETGFMTEPTSQSFWALVLAGGDGTRLQSLTHLIAGAPIPKQYCRILGPRSLLETTVSRIAPLPRGPCHRIR